MKRSKATRWRCRWRARFFVESSIQQNAGNTKPKFTYRGRETITVLQKEYKLPLDQMDILKKQQHTQIQLCSYRLYTKLESTQGPEVALRLCGMAGSALRCNADSEGTVPVCRSTEPTNFGPTSCSGKSVLAAKSDERNKETLFFFFLIKKTKRGEGHLWTASLSSCCQTI